MIQVVKQAKVPSRDGLWDISIVEGQIADISPSVQREAAAGSTAEPAEGIAEINAAGRLVLPGFVDAHIHLDKAYIHERCRAQTGDFPEALSETLAAKRAFTKEDMASRARRVLEDAVAFGTTLMRSHAEVDHILGLSAVEVLLELQDEFKDQITLQVAAFAQEGITNIDNEVELLRSAMRQGCNAIGSAPYVDPDGRANIRHVFDIAQEFNCDVDFHLDYHLGSEKPSLLSVVLEETQRRGWQKRVCLGHMTALSSLPLEELTPVAESLKTAGISVLALPASDIYMMARSDVSNKRRGVCPVHRLAEGGVCAAFATNNVQNLFTFTGDGDVLKVATLLAQVLQLGSRDAHDFCLQMATTTAARAIGVDHALEVGRWADLVILDCATPTAALAAPPVARIVLKHGVLVARTQQLIERPKLRGTGCRKVCDACRGMKRTLEAPGEELDVVSSAAVAQ